MCLENVGYNVNDEVMIDEIIKRLYLSDATSVISLKGQEEVRRLQITHILTVSAMCIPERSQIPGVDYKFLFALDMATQDMFADNLLSGLFLLICLEKVVEIVKLTKVLEV
uniref:AAA_6 domain-containing protein n=1 Tax=Syphacia muris TaxID=451379 RepID=A0A0N5APD6_9BILA